TPICNPGRQAIEAVLQPRESRELYFVADGSGGHAFAETLKDHNANVQKWRLVEKDLRAKTASEPVPEEQSVKLRPGVKQRAAARAKAEAKPEADQRAPTAADKAPVRDPATAADPAAPEAKRR